MTVKIVPAKPGDLPALFALLEDSGLPTAGLSAHLPTALVARAAGGWLGAPPSNCMERMRGSRSVAVAAPLRGQGLGERLTHAALDLA
jgi:GNAT superfamily N-acetyltransferase